MSEVGPKEAVDDEICGGIEHDQVPDDAVCHPPLGGDVVSALPLVAF